MLKVHFLNVGHGDCTIIEPPSGRLTMIDINNSQDFDDATREDLLEQETARLATLSHPSPMNGGAFGAIPSPGRRSLLADLLAPPAAPTPRSSVSELFGAIPTPPARSPIEGGIGAYLFPTHPLTLSALARQAEEARRSVEAKGKRELTDPIEYMKRVFPGRSLWRFVLTHPDLDHMRGLARLKREIGFANFWDTGNAKRVPSFRSEADREDWAFYQARRREPRALTLTRGSAGFAFNRDAQGFAGGDGIEILSPTPWLVDDCNRRECFNDISVVLRIRHAGISILLGGDAEKVAWDDMVRHYGAGLKSHVLKASHHGRDSGYHMEAVRHIAPGLTVMSVGGRPETDASAKYKRFSGEVATTRRHGDIQVHVEDDGRAIWQGSRPA